MEIKGAGYTLSNPNKINLVLGKNGCGKSTMLRRLEQSLTKQYLRAEQIVTSGQRTLTTPSETYGESRYITPERGGFLEYDPNLNVDDNSMSSSRRRNLLSNFRQQSVAQYRKLELSVLREFEKTQLGGGFSPYIDKINSLLDNIEIQRKGEAFQIFKKGTSNKLDAGDISSGESELISLAIELLIFSEDQSKRERSILFLDEPDVHIHPDLQVRLMKFLRELVEANDSFIVVIATHSTAILSALEPYDGAHLAFMSSGQNDLEFNPISEIHKKILPVLGAHPLSNLFDEESILLLEGEDDERIWQQVVRSSGGKVRVHPRSVEGITKLNEFEKEAQKIIETVYDNAKGYSLRDRDETTDEISDLAHVKRMKLSCRASENLLLSDEVLEKLGCSWDCLKAKVNSWLKIHRDHGHYAIMSNFKDEGYDRKNFDLKKIRNDLMGIIGSEKPWEVAVGQAIATMTWNDNTDFNEDGKLLSFLGEKIVRTLLPNNKD